MKWQWSIGETSAKCRPSVGKVSLIGRSNIDRLATDISTDYRATYIGRQSADCRPTIDRHIGLLSTNYRPTSGRLSTDISTDHRPTCRSTYRSICRSTLPIVKLIPWVERCLNRALLSESAHVAYRGSHSTVTSKCNSASILRNL